MNIEFQMKYHLESQHLSLNASSGRCTYEIAKKFQHDAEAFESFVTFTFLSSTVLSPLIHLNMILGPGWRLAYELQLRASLFPDKTESKYLLILIDCINPKWLQWNWSAEISGFPYSSL